MNTTTHHLLFAFSLSALFAMSACSTAIDGENRTSRDGLSQGLVCVDGDERVADDGCNTCGCLDGEWACTQLGCVDDGVTNELPRVDDGDDTVANEPPIAGGGGDDPISGYALPIEECAPDAKSGAAYSVDAIDVEADILSVDVGYSGGCKDHEFELCYRPQFTTSHPPRVNLVLRHRAKGDRCEAYAQETRFFNLAPLKQAFLGDTVSSEPGTLNGALSLKIERSGHGRFIYSF